jgi:hypothetical protein
MRRKPLLGLALSVVLATTATACGGDDENVNGSKASSTSDTAAEVTSTTSSTVAPAPGQQTSVPATSPKRFLTDMKALRVDGKDVVQFTFQSGAPGYSAQYAATPITDEGEGKPVSVNGTNVVKIVFESAATVDLTGGLKEYYTGPARITPAGTSVITELVKVGEFEGRLVLAVGTNAKTDFDISTNGNIVTLSFG